MLFPVGQPSAAWAASPRTFLGPVVPGYISPAGTVCLPLHMDGRMTDTAVHYRDQAAMSDFVRRNALHFATRNPIPDLSLNEADYRRRFRPEWLMGLWDDMRKAVEEYASRLDHSRKVLDMLTGSLARFQPLVSGLLYAGPSVLPPGHFVLFSQDLSLYAQPVERAPLDAYPMLQLLGTLFHVERLLGWGLTDQLFVQEGENEEGTHRPFDPTGFHFNETVEFVETSGRQFRLDRCDVRPSCLYIADEDGRIDVHRGLQSFTHPAYRGFQLSLLQETNILLGYFLFAFHGMGVPELAMLRGQAPAPSKNLPTGFHGHIVSAALKSLFSSQ